MKSMISSKGQITVPVEIRRRLGLRPGTPVRFELKRNGALIRKGRSDAPDPLDQVYGILRGKIPGNKTTDELMELMRGPVPNFLKK